MPGESRSSPRAIQNYLGRISGPLLGRIDLHIEAPPVRFHEMSNVQPGGSSAQMVAVRKIQPVRFAGKPKVTCNARMGAREHLPRKASLQRSASREVVVAIANGKLDFGRWERVIYGDFDGNRRKGVLVKIIGD
jgi:magnesium chelatase family protein